MGIALGQSAILGLDARAQAGQLVACGLGTGALARQRGALRQADEGEHGGQRGDRARNEPEQRFLHQGIDGHGA